MHHSHRQPRDSNGRFADELRHTRVTVRLTEYELKALREASQRQDMTVTRLIASYAVNLAQSLQRSDTPYNPDVLDYYKAQRRSKRQQQPADCDRRV